MKHYNYTDISILLDKEKNLKFLKITIIIITIIMAVALIATPIIELKIVLGLIIIALIAVCLAIRSKLIDINNQICILEQQHNKQTVITENKTTKKYILKTKTLTENEQYFVNIIKKHYSNQYDIRVQVPLSSIIEKQKEYKNEYQNELNRIIDIGIFDKTTTTPLLLIEINDATHLQAKRKYRDMKVKEICEEAEIQLIAFWTNYSNTEQYIVERISKYLM